MCPQLIVTSNHVYLLVVDTEEGVIAKSLQLVAGRTAQEFNQRKNKKGAFWEDRYHATSVEPDDHLAKCIVSIDPNMVRAGVVFPYPPVDSFPLASLIQLCADLIHFSAPTGAVPQTG